MLSLEIIYNYLSICLADDVIEIVKKVFNLFLLQINRGFAFYDIWIGCLFWRFAIVIYDVRVRYIVVIIVIIIVRGILHAVKDYGLFLVDMVIIYICGEWIHLTTSLIH